MFRIAIPLVSSTDHQNLILRLSTPMETSHLLLIVGYFSLIFAVVLGFLYRLYRRDKAKQKEDDAPRAARGGVAAGPADGTTHSFLCFA